MIGSQLIAVRRPIGQTNFLKPAFLETRGNLPAPNLGRPPVRAGLFREIAAMKPLAFLPVVMVFLAGCSYLGTAIKQACYSVRQPFAPRQRVYKHMLSRDTYFVYGQIDAGAGNAGAPLAVVALSDAFKIGEVVDVNHTSRDDSFYGLNLPGGSYRLVVVRDRNGDGFFDEHEIIGGRVVTLNPGVAPEKVLGGCDITTGATVPSHPGFRIAVPPRPAARAESVFYPKGTIRTLDDPIFSPEMAGLGMYEPAAFMEWAPMLFYALEEDVGYKVPVVFVHGIGGSARDFSEIVAHLDRRLYRPWFFHYPSGTDLSQLSAMFYRLFLSGSVIPSQDVPMVIVAHSMGGLVVRDAFNRCTGRSREADVRCLITIASPLGGHPAAKSGTRAPVVIPSWYDLAPDSAFIRQLHRRPLPARTQYHLYCALGQPGDGGEEENRTDGVVPLASQRSSRAQGEAMEVEAFNDTHTGVLRNLDTIRHIVRAIETVRSPYPPDHLRVLFTGGYPVPTGGHYTPTEAYCIRTIGRYMDALVAGELKPVHPLQEHFVAACLGRCAPNVPAEHAWLKFNKERAAQQTPP